MATEPQKIPVVANIRNGSPREVGLRLGEQLVERISAAVNSLHLYESFRAHQPWWMPYAIYRYMAEWRALETLQPAVQQFFPDMAHRIRGMAEGASVRVETLYLFHAFEAMVTTFSAGCQTPLAACTAVAVGNKRSAHGKAMLCQNFDNVPLSAPLMTLRQRQSRGGYRCLEFTFAPLAGAINGINDKGLCIAYNFAWTTSPGPPAPPISMAISAALDRCDTVENAIRYLRQCRLCGGSMLMLADADGALARVECAGSRIHVTRGDAGDVMFHSNTYQAQRLKHFEVPPDTRFDDEAPQTLRGQRVLESAEKRDRRLASRLGGRSRWSTADLRQLMGDHGQTPRGDGNTICMHGTYWKTIASMQFHPHRRQISIGYGPACEAELFEFAL